MPLVPLFAAVLKVRLSRLGLLKVLIRWFTGVRFHGTCPNRKQGSALARSSPPHKESQIEKMASEGLTRDGGEAASDFEED